jgi:hypothetical protein
MYKELEKEKTVTISIMFELSVEHDIISNLVVVGTVSGMVTCRLVI